MIAREQEGVLRAEPAHIARVRVRARQKILWADRAPTKEALLLPAEQLSALEAAFYRSDPVASDLEPAIRVADRRWWADPVPAGLAATFRLSQSELDLLSLACAAESEPGLLRVYGGLVDEPVAVHASLRLAARLFDWAAPEWIGPDSPLLAWRMVRSSEPCPAALTPASEFRADPQLAALLHGTRILDPALDPHVRVLPPPAAPAGCLHPELLQELEVAIASLQPGPIRLDLVGARGSGRKMLAAQVAARLDRALLVVDVEQLLGGEPAANEVRDRLMRAVRSALLFDAVLYWDGADRFDSPPATPVEPSLQVMGLTRRRASRAGRQARIIVEVPPLTARRRCELWSWLRPEPPPAAVRDWALTPAEIAAVALAAPAGEGAVNAAARVSLKDDAEELFTALPTPFAWDDIVLNQGTRRHLEEFEAQARLRWSVYEEWGFGELCPLGQGVCALFAGPSGTGKTMAAQVIARSLGLEVYRVDLAGVVNKYIGETEKRLKQVFDACERANVLLLFDEADALFGQRTQVKDAHDRFANIEIDYLLQRMERFDGIAILATNRKSDLDRAFVRRLRFIVEFMNPGPEERRALWRKALPETAPSGEPLLDGIDWEVLTEKAVMSAAEIKLTALNAAFLARFEGSRIGMSHVWAAYRREAAKQGRELRGEPSR